MNHGVLFISPHRKDAATLGRMLAPVPLDLDHVATLAEARDCVGRNSYAALLTEAQLPDGDWVDVLDLAYEAPVYPAVIVTHRLADDRFWAEVLNMGAYDLLAQPFDSCEVQRILINACAQQGIAKPVCRTEPNAKPRSLSASF